MGRTGFCFVPNIEGKAEIYVAKNKGWVNSNCFTHPISIPNRGMSSFETTEDDIVTPYFNANLSDSLYGSSRTVQPNSIKIIFIIRFKS